MLTRLSRVLAGALAAGLFLTACSGDADTSQTPGSAPGDLPSISGEFGQAPEFTWPEGTPPEDLSVSVLSEGDGPEVAEGATVVANYAGYVWGEGEPFDSSYERTEPSSFPLAGVVRGWQEGIPGHAHGSRLLISIPPEYGYGEDGNPGAGIEGDDTIVFVVDVIASFAADTMGEPDADPVDLPSDVPVTVEGELGDQFEITVDEGAPEPEESAAYPMSEGSGPKVEAGDQVVIAYALTTWDNETTEASWMPELGPMGGPQSLPLGGGGPLDLLAGFEVGSRVLITHAPTPDLPAVVIVADIISAF